MTMTDMKDNFASGSMRTVLLFVLCGVMSFVSVSTYKTSIDVATLTERIDGVHRQLDHIVATQYTSAEAASMARELATKVEAVEKRQDKLEKAVDSLYRDLAN